MMEQLRLWLPIALWCVSIAYSIYVQRQGARKDQLTELHKRFADYAPTTEVVRLDARLAEVDGRLEQHQQDGRLSREKVAERLTKIEGTLSHLPDQAMTHRMEISIGEMRGDLAVLSERLKPVAAVTERLQDFLLEEARERRESR